MQVVTERYPLVYSPMGAADLNTERLPPPEEYSWMELAYRQQFYSEESLETIASTRLYTCFFLSLLAALAILLVGTVLSLSSILYFSYTFAFFLALYLVLRRNTNPVVIFFSLVIPPVVAVFLSVVAQLLAYRQYATPVLGVITFVLFLFYGRDPFQFYQDWLYASPLAPETRHNRRGVPARPNTILLIVVLAAAWIGPWLSVSVTILSIFIVTALMGFFPKPLLLLRQLKIIIGHYLTYGLNSQCAPGVWIPSKTLRHRHFILIYLMVALFLTLSVGLHLFCPYDTFSTCFKTDFNKDYLFEVNKDSLSQRLSLPWGWIDLAVIGIANGEMVYLLMFPIALFIAVVLPICILVALYRTPLAEAASLRNHIEKELDNDGRPPWQWYVDRIRGRRRKPTTRWAA